MANGSGDGVGGYDVPPLSADKIAKMNKCTLADFRLPELPAMTDAQCPLPTKGPPRKLNCGLDWGEADYNEKNVKANGPGAFDITLTTPTSRTDLDIDPQGARVVSKKAYKKCKVTATIASGATIPGIVAAFYLSNWEPDHLKVRTQDEVDFEMMGARKAGYMQTNIFTQGVGFNEKFHPYDHTLPTDYEIIWDVEKEYTLRWSQNGKLIDERTMKVQAPHRPMFIYLSFWGTKPCQGLYDAQVHRWAGVIPEDSYGGKTFTMKVTNFKIHEDFCEDAAPVYDTNKETPKQPDDRVLKNLARTCLDVNPVAPYSPQ